MLPHLVSVTLSVTVSLSQLSLRVPQAPANFVCAHLFAAAFKYSGRIFQSHIFEQSFFSSVYGRHSVKSSPGFQGDETTTQLLQVSHGTDS